VNWPGSIMRRVDSDSSTRVIPRLRQFNFILVISGFFLLSLPSTLFLAPSQKCEKRLLAFSCLSLCPSAWNNSAVAGRIIMKFDI
jgi:hypothetical protein